MDRFGCIALGVASLVPLASLVFFLLPLLAVLDAMEQAGDLSPQLVTGGGAYPVPALAAGALVALLLWVFYLIWLVRTPRLPREWKPIWIAALTFALPLAAPVLWWRYLRPRPDDDR